MRSTPITPTRLFALALVVALLSIGPTLPAHAATPSLNVVGQTTAPCGPGGKPAAAGHQGQPFSIEAEGLDDSEALEVWFTFPDGRIYSPAVASYEDSPTQVGLDGLLDRVADMGYPDAAEEDGSYFRPFPTTFKWPYGCYTITLKHGSDANTVTAPFVIVPERIVTSPGPARLTVQNSTTRGAAGAQDTKVSIIGNGFVADTLVGIEVIQPNGTVLSLPSVSASPRGGFQASYLLDTSRRIGQYTFIATGASDKPTSDASTGTLGRRVAATFSLTAKTLPPTGRLTLRVSRPLTAIVAQDKEFQIQGQRFNTTDPITMGLILPGGAILALPGLPTDPLTASGSFAEEITFDRQLPTGIYRMIAEQGMSRAVVNLKLTQGAP